MNAYSVLGGRCRPRTNEPRTAPELQQPVQLLPRTAADELPPYREQPSIIDERWRREIDPNLTLVPMHRW